MKRILFGLGCSMALTALPVAAQDRPAASFGRPVMDAPAYLSQDVRPAAAIDFVPKAMPKGTVSEASILPAPGPMAPVPGAAPAVIAMPPMPGPSLGMPGVYPAGPIPGGGPVMVQPPTMGGPVMMGGGPVIASPMGDCGPAGCAAAPMWGGYGVPAPMSRWYASAEYLLWWLKGYEAPPLVSVGPVAGQGILGTPGTAAVFPDGDLENNPQSGGRFSLGYWLSPKWAVEMSAFFIAPREGSYSANSAQYPNSILGRPFFSVNQNAEFVEQIGNPGVYAGSIDIRYKTSLFGAELNLRRHLYQTCTTKIDLLVGLRYMYLKDDLQITENVQGLAQAPRFFVGQQRSLVDNFETSNTFYGGQIGVAFERNWGRWTLTAQAKLAVGQTAMKSDISGGVTGGTPTQPGGLLALNSNIGSVQDNKLSYIPEINLNLGYDVTPSLRIFAGYSFLYWSHVARPGNQIDRSLDEYRIPDFTLGRNPPVTSETRPVHTVRNETFYAHGINVGLLYRW